MNARALPRVLSNFQQSCGPGEIMLRGKESESVFFFFQIKLLRCAFCFCFLFVVVTNLPNSKRGPIISNSSENAVE